MGRTIQSYRDGIRVFDNDIDLLIILSMIIETIKDHKNPNISACLAESAAHWEWVIKAYGPGSISLRLDESLKDETVHDAFLSVLRDVRTKLESFGDWVPLEFLNGLVMFSLLALPSEDPRIVISQAQPARNLLKVVRDLEELVSSSD
jgi:hypothetical protein